MHGLPGDNARGLQLDSGALVGEHGALSVDGVTEGVDDSAEHALADGHINDGSGSLDDIALLNLSGQRTQMVGTLLMADWPDLGRPGPDSLTYRCPR